jgi:hypothetical protein
LIIESEKAVTKQRRKYRQRHGGNGKTYPSALASVGVLLDHLTASNLEEA